MFSLIKSFLSGTTNTTSTKSEEKEMKMLNISTNIPMLDKENDSLLKAAAILESLGNEPNPSATEFYLGLLDSDLPTEDHESVTLAAISIETMMSFDMSEAGLEEPTIH
jgi:hypothetical protein